MLKKYCNKVVIFYEETLLRFKSVKSDYAHTISGQEAVVDAVGMSCLISDKAARGRQSKQEHNSMIYIVAL